MHADKYNLFSWINTNVRKIEAEGFLLCDFFPLKDNASLPAKIPTEKYIEDRGVEKINAPETELKQTEYPILISQINLREIVS